MRHQVFAILSVHAKLHKQLDTLDRKQAIIQRIEEDEIKAYDNDALFQKLESLKKQILDIRFV